MSTTRRRYFRLLAGGGAAVVAGCTERTPSTTGSASDAETRERARKRLADNAETLEAADEALTGAVSPSSLDHVDLDTDDVEEGRERVRELIDDAAEGRAATLRAIAAHHVAVADVLDGFLIAGREASPVIRRANRFEFEETVDSAARARDLADDVPFDAADETRQRVTETEPGAEVDDVLSTTDTVLERRREDLEGVLAVIDVLEAYGSGSADRLDGDDAYADSEYDTAETAFDSATETFDGGLERIERTEAEWIHVPVFADTLEEYRELFPAEYEYVSTMRKAAAAAAEGDEERAASYEAEADEAY